MKNTMFVLAPGVIVEDLGSDSAVFVPGVAEVLTLSGDAAAVIRRIRSGESVEGAEAVVSDLVARGVIQPAHGMSRRGVVRAGVIGAGVGVAALAMPSVAAASSPGGGSNGGGDSNGGGGGGAVFATFELRGDPGASLTESLVVGGSVGVRAVSAEGVEVSGVTIPGGTVGTVAINAKLGSPTQTFDAVAVAGANRFDFTGVTTGLTLAQWRGTGNHTLTFTFNGTQYVVEF